MSNGQANFLVLVGISASAAIPTAAVAIPAAAVAVLVLEPDVDVAADSAYEMIEQLQKQQEIVPKNEETTVSTKPTEPTTQTPSTPTLFDDENDIVEFDIGYAIKRVREYEEEEE